MSKEEAVTEMVTEASDDAVMEEPAESDGNATASTEVNSSPVVGTAAVAVIEQPSPEFLLSKELENGGLSANEYLSLFFHYLISGDLISAKLLWKRIRRSTKESTDGGAELRAAWSVCTHMMTADYSRLYPAITEFQWSDHTGPHAEALLTRLKERMLALIPDAYSSISLQQLAQLTCSSEADAVALCLQKHWRLDGNTAYPTPSPHTQPQLSSIAPRKERISTLTGYISFIEN